jgi:hypothetical protein
LASNGLGLIRSAPLEDKSFPIEAGDLPLPDCTDLAAHPATNNITPLNAQQQIMRAKFIRFSSVNLLLPPRQLPLSEGER